MSVPHLVGLWPADQMRYNFESAEYRKCMMNIVIRRH